MERGADPLVGRVLDRRYRFDSREARGGMATVYAGHDLRLGRRCAIKVMQTDLGEDPAFRDRFVAEAQAAASLSDPHVINIYDQGEDEGLLYLVMEFVAGNSLRDVIRAEAPMPPERALALLEPVLSACAAAHEAGLIHCDIKPENVLISDAGAIKVVDFGLARAFDASATATASSRLIGTASYLAPELIEGSSRITPRVDVYAAGVVLYEMLTGVKPHEGEGPVQIAYKHVHTDVPNPSAATVQPLPDYVDALVVRATSRDPERRQADAKVMLHQTRRVSSALSADLENDAELAADLLPPPPRESVVGIDYVEDPDEEAMEVARATTDEESTSIISLSTGTLRTPALASAGPAAAQPSGARAMTSSGVSPVGSARTRPSRGSTAEVPRTAEFAGADGDRRSRRRRGPVLLLLALVLVAVAAYGGWWLGFGRYTVTPGVLNLRTSLAQERVEGAGLAFDVSDRAFSEDIPAGSVVSTDPGAGEQILQGGTVEAVVSLGPERYEVPAVAGQSVEEATIALREQNLEVGKVNRIFNLRTPAGEILRTFPRAGTELRRDGSVTLNVSKGPRPIKIEDFTDTSAAQAEKALGDAGFEVSTTAKFNDTVAKGDVIDQTPSSGTGIRGDTITLTVSKGPVLVAVPNLRALSVQEATSALESVGLKIQIERSNVFVGLDRVVTQSTDDGDRIPKGSTVTVQIV